jgi:hypothetical protein
MMMKTKSLLCATGLALTALACGSYADDPGAPTTIATIRGEVKSPDTSVAAPSNFRVALVWMGDPYNVATELSVVPKFPASFQLEIQHLPPKSAMQTDEEVPGLKLAVGAVVGYEDLNGNGKLDMVDSGSAEFVDRVVATNESFVVLYTEGSKEAYQTLPEGFNMITPGFGLLEVRASEGALELEFHPLTKPYDLTLVSDPRLNELMCTTTPGSSGGGSYEVHEGRPAAYPDPADPNLICNSDAASYVLSECETISHGPCAGTETSCTAHYWYRPDPVPADWPCP